jgi:hypothetical protein
MILTDAQTKLRATTAVTTLVPSASIYIGQPTQTATPPYIAISKVSNVMVNTDAKFMRDRLQFTCWGDTLVKADSIVTAVRNTFLRFTGNMGLTNVGNIQVDNITYLYDSTTSKHVFIMDAFFQYLEI